MSDADNTYTNYVYQVVNANDKLGYSRASEEISTDLTDWGSEGYRVVAVVGKRIIMELADVRAIDEEITIKKT